MNVSEEIRDALERAGWTHQKLCDEAAINRQYLSRVLHGRNTPTVDWADRVLRVLGRELVVRKRRKK